MRMLAVACVLALASSARAQSNQVSYDGLEAYEGQKTCAILGREPETPRALSFCNRYNNEACCVPGIDADNHEFFSTLTDVGLSCRLRGDIRDHPVARLYCLNCDPNQPRYYRPERYESPDDNAERARDDTILVCKDWADREFGDLSRFDACGFLVSSACLGETGKEIPDRDRYTCGDDIVIPSNEIDNSLSQTENVELFLNFPSFGTPEMGDFGFKVVENRECLESEFNQTNPSCLRTADQLERRRGSRDPRCDTDQTYVNNNPGECVPYQNEMCFSSSSSSAFMAMGSLPMLLATLIAAAVFL